MTELNFDLGLKSFSLNGEVEVSFNDTDFNFIERLWDVFYDLDAKQEGYKKKVETIASNKEAFAFMRTVDGEMREKINGLFGKEVCVPVFGHMNLFALCDGLPIWANLLLSVIDQCDDGFSREQKAINPRVQKYTAKWGKK